MRFPPELVEVDTADDGFAADFRECVAIERSVHTMSVVILPKAETVEAIEALLPGNLSKDQIRVG